MAILEQHIPSFCEGFEPKIGDFKNLQELLEIDFVKDWSKKKDFYRYSLSSANLMAEFNKGNKWYVIGYLRNYGIDLSNLPRWEAKRK